MGTTTVPVAVIDDHHLMRSALVRMIDHFPGYEVVLEAGNGADGFATIAWIRGHMPGTRALAFTLEMTEETMLRALRDQVGHREALEGHFRLTCSAAWPPLFRTAAYTASPGAAAVAGPP